MALSCGLVLRVLVLRVLVVGVLVVGVLVARDGIDTGDAIGAGLVASLLDGNDGRAPIAA